MRFCIPHWKALHEAIRKRGLWVLVAESGEEAAAKLTDEIAEGRTIDNFDPLMDAHNAIMLNAMSAAGATGQDPLLILAPDLPEELQCPICYLNKMYQYHDETCEQTGCNVPKGYTNDWMVDRAADDALEKWKELKP